MTLRQLGSFILLLQKNGTIRASYRLDQDDWAQFAKLGMADLIERGKINKQELNVNTPAPTEIEIINKKAVIPSSIDATSIEQIQFLDGGGNASCDYVTMTTSTRSALLCDSKFSYYYVTGNIINLINANDVKKVRIFQNATTDLDSPISDAIAYKVLLQAISLGLKIQEADIDTSVNGSNLKDTVTEQLRNFQNNPNNVN